MAELDTKVESFVTEVNDTRNIRDEFKGMTEDVIRLRLQERRVPAVNVCMNLTHDFNKGAVMRASEAFGFAELVFVNKEHPYMDSPEGVKKWNRRGAVGTQNYHPFRYTIDWKGLFEEFREQGYTVFAVDNIPEANPKSIYDTDLPEKSVFVYGEENLGLSPEMIEACDDMVYIPQYGVVRSLNISQAAAVVMSEYSRQNRPQL